MCYNDTTVYHVYKVRKRSPYVQSSLAGLEFVPNRTYRYICWKRKLMQSFQSEYRWLASMGVHRKKSERAGENFQGRAKAPRHYDLVRRATWEKFCPLVQMAIYPRNNGVLPFFDVTILNGVRSNGDVYPRRVSKACIQGVYLRGVPVLKYTYSANKIKPITMVVI